MQTMYPGIVNSPVTELAAAIDDAQTTIDVLDGVALPDAPNLAVIGQGSGAETILYTSKASNTLSGVTRGFQGVAVSHQQGTKVARNFTEHDYAALVANINELESSKETPSGAQAKADAAEQNANTYTDGYAAPKVHEHAASAITSGTIAAARLPAATTSAAGISRLNNTITSSSTTEAAAAAAVKQVNDKFSNMIRVNGGKLEYWNGSAWKGVGGVTHLVNSTTVVQEKTTGNVVLQADERKFLFAFYPKGTGAINVYASFKDPEIAMENQRGKIRFTSSTRYGSSATRPDLVKVDYHSISGNGHETYFDLTLPQGAASRSANNTDSEAAFDVRLPPGSGLTLIGRIVINNTSPITFEISNPSNVEQTLTALQLRYTIKDTIKEG